MFENPSQTFGIFAGYFIKPSQFFTVACCCSEVWPLPVRGLPGGYKPSAPGAVSQAGEWECSPRFGDAEKGPGIFCLSIPIGFLLVENQCFLSWVSWVLNWSVSLFCALFSPMILRSLTKNLAWFWWWALVILHDQFARWLLWPSGRSLLLCLVAPTSFPSMFWKLTSGKMRCNLMVGNDCPFPR